MILAAARRSSIRPLVQDPRNTRSIFTSVMGMPGLEVHVLQCSRDRVSLGRVVGLIRRGNQGADRDGLPGVGAPGDVRLEIGCRQVEVVVERCAVVGWEAPPRFQGLFPEGALGCKRSAFHVLRRSCRRGRSFRLLPRPRSTCCRSSCGLPSKANESCFPGTRSRARSHRRSRSGR